MAEKRHWEPPFSGETFLAAVIILLILWIAGLFTYVLVVGPPEKAKEVQKVEESNE